jgi:hypothetical protein
MQYRILADAVMVLHFAFILFAIFGALLVRPWPRIAWLHLPCLAWAVWIGVSGSYCPLTPLENHLRELAGEQGYAGGFVAHYIAPIVYAEGLTRGLQLAMAVVLVLVNAVGYGWFWAARRKSLIR